jgi:short-subunit dehydrogenase involved in D-alanine esterification of teichoic acids
MYPSNNMVLITGGSSGIGLALAKQFVRAGNHVIITGRDQDKLASVQSVLPTIQAEQTDMTDVAALQQLTKKYPDINVLINNAAVQYNYSFADQQATLNMIDAEVETNLLGPLHLIKLLLPQFVTKESAAIVNVSSGLGFVPKQNAPVYCGTKAGLHIFTKALRWQLDGTAVKVFEIIPPLVDTDMTRGRGKGKITPDAVADAFWTAFQHDRVEIPVGRTRLLLALQRLFPRLADRIMRPGL